MRSLFLALFSLTFSFIFAQTPQAINYQAVARTSTGAIIPSQTVQVRFSILDGSVSGTVLYQETQYSTTNNYGLFTMAIGKGTSANGAFSNINWASGTDKFLKVEIAPNGTNNYSLQGTTQLLSAPYALYAEKTRLIAGNAISVTNGNTIAANYTGGTGININGPTISTALQAGTGIGINGATISNTLKGGTGIRISNDTVYHNLQAGTGIALNGATISHNLVAGPGINISGNTISSTGSGTNYWISDPNGIHNTVNNVGIGTNAHPTYPLYVRQPNTGSGNSVAVFEAEDSWHAAIAIRNSLNNRQFALVVGGPNNLELFPNNFGLLNSNLIKWAMIVNGLNNNVGFGSPDIHSTAPKSTVHLFTGDVNIEQIGSGIILKSPNGQCWRVTIDNAGNLVRTAITCP